MAGEQGEEDGRAPARPTLAERFQERRIRVETMEVRLRAATAGAAAVLFAGAIFVALRGIHTVGVYLGESPQGVTSIPEPMFIATLVLTAVGFAYMLTGVALASPSVAIPAVALIVGGVGLYTGAFGSVIGGLDYFILLPAWARWSLRGILVVIALLAALAIAEGFRLRRQAPAVSDRALAGSVAAADQATTPAEAAEGGGGEAAGGSPERSVRLAMLAATSILFGGYLLILRAASPTEGGLNEFGPLVGAILITLAIALYPILTVAAVDFAEWGQMASEFVTDRVQRNRGRWVFHFSVLCAMGLVVYAYLLILPGRGVFSAGRVVHCLDALLLVAILLAVILGAGRLLGVHSRRWPESLNFAALAAVCAVTTVIVPPLAGRLSGELGLRSSPPLLEDGHYAPGADVVTLASTGNPPFSILVPRGWLPQRGPRQVVASDYLGGVQEVAAVQVPAGPLQAAVAGAK
ncbi:MAG TPA: hypothetical protein VFH70_00385, partial [Acidimicrobiales bacterium]|nr:hypothetical protein [Acidimicrobiales bacterium]